MKFKLQLCRDEKNHCFEMFFFFFFTIFLHTVDPQNLGGDRGWGGGGGHNLSEALKIKGRLI